MKYLVSVTPVETGKDDKDDWAPEGEPVVPWYPITSENVFVSTTSFKKAALARVVNTGADPDIIAKRLWEQYPGLPVRLHQNYVLETAKAACMLPLDTIVRIFLTHDSARLQSIKDENIITMWETQPL